MYSILSGTRFLGLTNPQPNCLKLSQNHHHIQAAYNFGPVFFFSTGLQRSWVKCYALIHIPGETRKYAAFAFQLKIEGGPGGSFRSNNISELNKMKCKAGTVFQNKSHTGKR